MGELEWLFVVVWILIEEETLGKVEGAGMAAQHLTFLVLFARLHMFPLVIIGGISSDSSLIDDCRQRFRLCMLIDSHSYRLCGDWEENQRSALID